MMKILNKQRVKERLELIQQALSDGDWHLASDITSQSGVSRRDIVYVVALHADKIISTNGSGYRLVERAGRNEIEHAYNAACERLATTRHHVRKLAKALWS